MLDKQAVLEATTMAIVTQDGPAMRGMQCSYRSSKGLRCAIGHLISDEYYSSHFEGEPLTYTLVLDAVSKSLGVGLDSEEVRFLSDLQQAHDNASQLSDFFIRWTEQLRYLCELYKLRFPEELV